MRILICDSYDDLCRAAAKAVAGSIRHKPNCVLGFATGGTPEGMYAELGRLHKEEGLDFARVTTFNLDEYVGLAPGHGQSCHYYMQDRLFRHVNIDPRNTHIPDGMAEDLDAECVRYEQMIEDLGGIDVQLLGIGINGHIAFNEPVVSSFASRTRVVTLSAETRRANSRFFGSLEAVPRRAVSLGLGTILEHCRQCLLFASGANKAKAVAAAIEGPVTARVPASALQLHPDVTFMLDEDAAALLEFKGYCTEPKESALLAAGI